MRHAVLDREARRELREIGAILAVRRLPCLIPGAAEHRLGLAQDPGEVDTLDRAVLQVQLRRAGERALDRVDAGPRGSHVERDVAAPFELVLLREIPEQRADRNIAERLLGRDAVAVAVEAQGAVKRTFIKIRRMRPDLGAAVCGSDLRL